jgi:3-methylfumaryl-CoA hydratase
MLQEWVGRQEQAHDELTLPAVRRLAALLDLTPDDYRRGQPIPGGWYVVLFGGEARQSMLGPDGHPAKGQFLPPVLLPRRMFAGRRVWFHAPLRIGDEVSRVSRIQSITPKQGRSGAMCFVTVRHEIASLRGLAVVEEQDLVYRESSPAAPAGGGASPALQPDTPEWTRALTPDPTMVFRYSAITFNAHRIHYDAAYARGEEGYPDLVVNGGLTTSLLWEFATSRTGMAIKSSASRNVKALFVNRPLTLCGRRAEGDKARVWALDSNGELALDAELEMGRS